MKLIVGLGNPGKEYAKTRHNTGFRVMDLIADNLNIPITNEKFKALIGQGMIGKEKVLLMKPLTYMNNSGQAVQEACSFYKINPDDVLVIYDDMDLGVGQIRLREKGSNGGHNGIRSIINLLGTNQIKRIRIGIGNHGIINGPDYVLGHLSKDEETIMAEAFQTACDAAIATLTKPFDIVMNNYNRKN